MTDTQDFTEEADGDTNERRVPTSPLAIRKSQSLNSFDLMNKSRSLLLLSLVCFAVVRNDVLADDPQSPRDRAEAALPTQKMTWSPLSINGKSVRPDDESNDSDETIDAVSFTPDEYSEAFDDSAYVESPYEGEVIYEGNHAYEEDFAGGGGIPCDCQSGCDRCYTPAAIGSYWLRAEYMLWSIDGIDLPPLVTTSTAGTLPEDTGILGQAGTTVLFGNDTELDSMRSGLRITLGWNGDRFGNGFEMSGMGIFDDDESFSSSAALLARPVFDASLGSESAMLVAHPDFLTGNVNVRASNQLASFDVNRRQVLSSRGCQRLDLLVGYRYGNLEEMLRIEQSSLYTAAEGPIIAGTTVGLFDDFQTENQFHGAQLGLHFQQRSATTTLDTYAKVGFGVNRAETTISGQTTNTVPGGGDSTFEGGLLAQSTNIGSYDESQFMALPEIGFNLTTRVRRDMQLTIGYSLMYWSDAVRLEDAIDRTVSQFPPEAPAGARRPDYELNTTSFLAHGLSIGAAFNY